MWFIDAKDNTIVSSDTRKQGYKYFYNQRNKSVQYYIGTISKCHLGVLFSNGDTNNPEGVLKDNDKFGFVFEGKNIETGEEVKRHFHNIKEIYVVVDGKPVMPYFLNATDSMYCIIRTTHFKKTDVDYPEVIYPLGINLNYNAMGYKLQWREDFEEDIDEKIINQRKLSFYYKLPKMKWTK